MKKITDRLQAIVDTKFNGNKAAFAKAIGIAPTSITNYIGKTRASKPSSDMLEKIVNSLDVDAMWLLTGKGEMTRSLSQPQVNEELIKLRTENALLRDLLDDAMEKLRNGVVQDEKGAVGGQVA